MAHAMKTVAIKTVDFCFAEREQLQFHFLCDQERSAVDRVVGFLHGMNAVICDLEQFSDDEIGKLKASRRYDGQPLFASQRSCSSHDCKSRDRCLRFRD